MTRSIFQSLSGCWLSHLFCMSMFFLYLVNEGWEKKFLMNKVIISWERVWSSEVRGCYHSNMHCILFTYINPAIKQKPVVVIQQFVNLWICLQQFTEKSLCFKSKTATRNQPNPATSIIGSFSVKFKPSDGKQFTPRALWNCKTTPTHEGAIVHWPKTAAVKIKDSVWIETLIGMLMFKDLKIIWKVIYVDSKILLETV